MSFVMVDVETDGPIPGEYSMISFGAVVVEPSLSKTFLGLLKPISERFYEDALSISGYTREQTLTFSDPVEVMLSFEGWLEKNSTGRPIFISDNNGFDFQFISWYFHKFLGRNPFGWSSRRLPDLYCGMMKDVYSRWKHLRVTKHTHNPVDDAKGNAEVLLKLKEMGLKINLE